MPEPDNLGRKILSFFITDAEPARPGAAPAPAAPAGAGMPPAPVPTGQHDSKFAEHLAGVLAKNNPPGPDYFEFRETLRSLTSLDLSEEKQFQAAWASFKAMGGSANVTALTTTGQHYLTVLGADRDAFAKSVDEAINERVGGLQKEQQQLQADNEALARQLAEIQQKQAANNARLAAIGGEITEQSGRLNQNRQNYEVTYAHFAQQIEQDLQKITRYLR
ncbi:hypothetical protein [Hymenobacter chitinivorans]|uniref:Uncharacterized protein n=1 Tax=Hymenobacter chitinivorans DSM 11115 TaxID=1121954 RepID=A0A2M9BLR7_9BACT|nr:hypothetical protein [Hymenobacter chitinivorans]PJJ58860.1 hypothetical protein CLV45_0271 [Hymenobacter chitinivorans DSM 11115]